MKKIILATITTTIINAQYIDTIGAGTYRVFKNEGQSLRTFKIEREGYVNIVPTPTNCMEVLNVLNERNIVIRKYQIYRETNINEKLPAGKYMIQVIPKNDCTINVTLPW